MRYRALSLHQPHALLIAEGIKTIETRSKRTHIRGDVLICAAQKCNAEIRAEIQEYRQTQILHTHRYSTIHYGKAMALVEIYDCVPLKEEMRADAALLYNHDIEGKWAYMLRNIRPVRGIYTVKGRQGFFFVDSEQVCRMDAIPLESAYTDEDLQRITRERKRYYENR